MISGRFLLRVVYALLALCLLDVVYHVYREEAEFERQIQETRDVYERLDAKLEELQEANARYSCGLATYDFGPVDGKTLFFPSTLTRCPKYLPPVEMLKIEHNLMANSMISRIEFRDIFPFVAKFGSETYTAQSYEDDGLTWYVLPEEFVVTNVTEIRLADCSENVNVSPVPDGVLVLTVCN